MGHTFNVEKAHGKFYPLSTTSTESLPAVIILGGGQEAGKRVLGKKHVATHNSMVL